MRRTACERCRARKLKCGDTKPCRQCLQSGHECVMPGLRFQHGRQVLPAPASKGKPAMLEEGSIIDLSRQLLLDDNPGQKSVQTIEALPGSQSCQRDDPSTFRWRDELSYILPAPKMLNTMLDSYFSSVNWFMMVVDEASFREKSTLALSTDYMMITDRNFCFLMSLVWGLGAHYLWANPKTSQRPVVSSTFRTEAIRAVDSAYPKIMSSPSLETIQIAILLGSFHLFNGLPYLGFAIFGSGVRCAQAIGLHRQSGGGSPEACRVWWALEIADKYASVAFGLPCAIDDSDCDVPEIDESFSYTGAATESAVTPLTYHILKGRLYRIMGPFLSRKKQTNRLRGLLDVHHALTSWYSTIPDNLKCGTGSLELDDRPIFMQTQAIALQLAYDNLQMVLFRQAVFPKDPAADLDLQRIEGIRQLSQSATRTADISTFAATLLVCSSSHAAMHVGICSFTAGVILCTLIAHHPDNQDKQLWLASLKKIITLFEQFPNETYRLATQSLQFLKALELRIDPGAVHRPIEVDSFGYPTQTNVPNLMMEPLVNSRAASVDANTDDTVGLTFSDFDFTTNDPLNEVGQLWLWNDGMNNNDWTDFS